MNLRHFSFFRSCYVGFALLLAMLGLAWTPADAYDPQTTCRVTLYYDADFSNPSNPYGGNGLVGNPPPGSIVPGRGALIRPRFTGSTAVPTLDYYLMYVPDMNPFGIPEQNPQNLPPASSTGSINLTPPHPLGNLHQIKGLLYKPDLPLGHFDSDYPGFGGELSSIKFEHVENGVYVPGCDSWTAILFEEENFTGNSVALTGSMSRLSDIGWNDRAESFLLIGPASAHSSSPPDGCTVELYEPTLSGDTWGGSSHETPTSLTTNQGAGKISSIRFGGECGTTKITLFDSNLMNNSITFTNADSEVFHLDEFGWNDRAMVWTADFDVAPDPSPTGCILRFFDGNEYTLQSWAVAESQTTGTIVGSQGAGAISSLAFEGECGDSEVIFDDGNGNQAYVRAADGAQHPLWLSDWNDRAVSWTANFLSGPATSTDPALPVPSYVPCEARLYDGIYSGTNWGADTDQAINDKFSSYDGAGSISSVEFRGAWCHDTYLELYDVDPVQNPNAQPYIVKVADGARRDLAALGFDNKTQFWRVNFSDQPATPSVVPNVVNMMYTDAEDVLRRMFYTPVKDPDYVVTHAESRNPDGKVLWTSAPSGALLPAGTPLSPGSAVHYTKYRHPQGPPPPPAPGPTGIASFVAVPGFHGIDIAISGPKWAISRGGRVFWLFMSTWKERPGVTAVSIAAGTAAYMWVVDQAGSVFRTISTYSPWVDMSAGAIPAQDIGYGYGNIWIAGSNPPYDIQRFSGSSNPNDTWDQPISVPGGGAKRISGDLHGNPWVVTQSGQIYRHLVGGWQALPGSASDIGCGANGDVWMVGTTPVAGGYEIFRWNEDLFNWELVSGIGGVGVYVSHYTPHVAADDGTFYKGTLNPGMGITTKPPKSHPPVPSVAGMTTADAISALQNAGYVVVHTNTIKTTDSNLFNTIESMTPAGGTPLAPGSIVSYVDYQQVNYQFLGGNPIHVKLGDSFSDPGVNEVAVDGTILQTISGDVAGVNTGAVGEYRVPYVITEADGSTVPVAELIVNVYDYLAPVITLNGSSPMDAVGVFTDPGATALDDVDGPVNVVVEEIVLVIVDQIGQSQETVVSAVGTSPGEYILTYAATDAAGNKATATRLVRRSEGSGNPVDPLGGPGGRGLGGPGDPGVVDVQAPTITLYDASEIDVAYGAAFTDPGAGALDNVDGAVTVNVSGEVNTGVLGDYTLTYTATDAAGNTATTTRLVHVIPGFYEVGGALLEIAIGADGSIFGLALDKTVRKWDGTAWQAFGNDWGFEQISVDHNGFPWVLATNNIVYRWDPAQSTWVNFDYSHNTISGTFFNIVYDARSLFGIAQDNTVRQWNGASWNQLNGNGLSQPTRMAVKPNGDPWVLAQDGSIWAWSGSAFGQWSDGRLLDIAFRADLNVFGIGLDHTVQYWNGTAWGYLDGENGVLKATRIAIDPSNNIWVIAEDNTVWRWNAN